MCQRDSNPTIEHTAAECYQWVFNAAGLNMFFLDLNPPPIPLANVEKQTHAQQNA